MVEDEDKYAAPKPRGGGRATGAPREKKRRGTKRVVSEASLANLRPRWQPGQSGNPGGKPQSLIEITKLACSLSPPPSLSSTRFCTIQKHPLATR
jgi:hypothetical protein